MGNKLLCLNLEDGSFKESIDTGLTKSVTVLYLSKYDKFVIGDWKSHKMVLLKNTEEEWKRADSVNEVIFSVSRKRMKFTSWIR